MTDLVDAKQNGPAANARDFFRAHVAAYDATHYGSERSFMSDRLSLMTECVDRLNLPNASRALEAGCGPGRLVATLASKGMWVCAIDTSPQMLQLARMRLRLHDGAAPARLALGDIEQLPFPGASFDLVCTAGVVEYLSTDARALAELTRVLRPGGYLLYPVTNSLSPVLSLESVVEAIKRMPRVLALFNTFWTRTGREAIRPRHFAVRTQSPSSTKRQVEESGLRVSQEHYFFLPPFPHPFNRLFPRLSSALGALTSGLVRTPLRGLAEGYMVVAQKPDLETSRATN